MNKLFLTSAVALCVACPAFAATDITPGKTNNENCTDTYLGDGAGDSKSANLEAIWNAVNYTIAFDAGTAGSHTPTGNTASVSPVTFDSTNIALTANNFSQTGWHFTGWQSPVDLTDGTATSTLYRGTQAGINDDYTSGTVASYGYNAPLSDPNDPTSARIVTLTAQWAANKYTVSYAAGTHGSGSSTDTNGATYDSDYTLKLIGSGTGESGVVPDSGYHFVKWNATSTDTNYSAPANGYDNGYEFEPYTIDGNLSLVAEFAATGYQIHFAHGTAGSRSADSEFTVATMANQNVTYDSGATINANAFVIPGYNFNGWSVSGATGTEPTSYVAGYQFSPYNLAHDLYLTATWTPKSHTLTYDCGTATGGDNQSKTIGGTAPAGGSFAYDSEVTLATTAENCALTGYTFVRWDCTGNAANDPTSGKYTWTQDNDITCTAQWTANNIAISWYRDSVANGATTPMESNQCTYDGAITLPTQPNKTGYTFQGWKIRAVPQQQGQ